MGLAAAGYCKCKYLHRPSRPRLKGAKSNFCTRIGIFYPGQWIGMWSPFPLSKIIQQKLLKSK